MKKHGEDVQYAIRKKDAGTNPARVAERLRQIIMETEDERFPMVLQCVFTEDRVPGLRLVMHDGREYFVPVIQTNPVPDRGLLIGLSSRFAAFWNGLLDRSQEGRAP